MLAHLRHAILTQTMVPGEDLDEATLSDRWQLSRTPLRDVLRQLAGEGYVEIRENRGARVAEMRAWLLDNVSLIEGVLKTTSVLYGPGMLRFMSLLLPAFVKGLLPAEFQRVSIKTK